MHPFLSYVCTPIVGLGNLANYTRLQTINRRILVRYGSANRRKITKFDLDCVKMNSIRTILDGSNTTRYRGQKSKNTYIL